jgi:hypothetical protein
VAHAVGRGLEQGAVKVASSVAEGEAADNPNETSALATEIALRSSEEWALITLPRHGSPRSRGKTEPTTFETLIV